MRSKTRSAITTCVMAFVCGLYWTAAASAQPTIPFKSRELQEGKNYVQRLTTSLNVGESTGQLSTAYPIAIPALRDRPWTPRVPPALRDEDTSIFAAIRAGDLLVHHPYESFDASVERFIGEGAADPSTVGLKLTVYRVGDDTPFVRSLVAPPRRPANRWPA